ncbi:MAG: type IV pilus modification PilV family protein, partial [Mycobacteriales bacterium]
MGRLTLRRSAQPSDAGFTLIEAVASLAIATLLLTGLAFATVGSLRGSATARINQQAGDVLESAIEAARDQAYDDLVMYTGDPNLSHTADSRILQSGCPSGGSMCVSVPNPTGSGSTTENIVTSTAIGFQSNHIQTQTSG